MPARASGGGVGGCGCRRCGGVGSRPRPSKKSKLRVFLKGVVCMLVEGEESALVSEPSEPGTGEVLSAGGCAGS